MNPRLGVGSEAEKLSSPRTPKKKPSLRAEDEVVADFGTILLLDFVSLLNIT